MVSAAQDENAPEPRGFRHVQHLACAEAVAGRLGPGVTEREAARIRRLEPGMPFIPERSALRPDDDLPHGRHRAEEKVAA